MKTHSGLLVFGLLTTVLLSTNSLAQNGNHRRAGTSEFYLLLQQWSSEDTSIPNLTLPIAIGPNPPTATSDLRFDYSEETMWGFGGGYNFSDLLFLRGEMTFGSPDYAMTWNNTRITGESWIHKGSVNLDLNLLKNRPFSPFISGGIGYFYVDTGIPNGPPQYTVWWDYYWGPVVVGSQPTYTDWYFTYNVAAGVRWDINDRMSLRFVAATNWVEAHRDTLQTYEATFGLSFRY